MGVFFVYYIYNQKQLFMSNLKITFSNNDQFLVDVSKLSLILNNKFGKSVDEIGSNLLPFFVLENLQWNDIKEISTPILSQSFAYGIDYSFSAQIEVVQS